MYVNIPYLVVIQTISCFYQCKDHKKVEAYEQLYLPLERILTNGYDVEVIKYIYGLLLILNAEYCLSKFVRTIIRNNSFKLDIL